MKKIKDTFDHHPSVQLGLRPYRKVKLWTPKGVCKITANNQSASKKTVHPIPPGPVRPPANNGQHLVPFSFMMEIPFAINDTKKDKL